ncbi:copper amine oxidase N-terminal domain-containing protein [Paenibacillus sp. 1781tsa1]|uniref:copper amine oxidase N-terminal domain-containing protein n=1 Tax=Paenibacillus sp. 1781tsa1 TaxID=2953810 RepID=UPI0020A065A4|nr:copper amine oxidase N-terminal domain-containing protein [Paenibacillus sp. 1781tsa1]MCP1182098.1 copper amine oxidase N-terminal domain-containing protein [Paenibacillus sp. 1781tsa1]
MRKLVIYCFTFVLIITMLGLPGVQEKAEAATAIPILVNGEKVKFEVDPIQTAGTTLVQFTPIFQKLDLLYQWNNATKTVTAMKEGLTIELTLGKKQAIVNGSLITLQVAPRLVKGKMFVPLRLVSEATGANITIKKNTIYIATSNSNATPDQTLETKTPSINTSSARKAIADAILNDLAKNKSQLVYDGIVYENEYLVEISYDNNLEITMLYDIETIDHIYDAEFNDQQASIYMTVPISDYLHEKYEFTNIHIHQAFRGVYDSDPSGDGNDNMHEPSYVKYIGGKYVVTYVITSCLFDYKSNKVTLIFDTFSAYPSTISVITIP